MMAAISCPCGGMSWFRLPHSWVASPSTTAGSETEVSRVRIVPCKLEIASSLLFCWAMFTLSLLLYAIKPIRILG